MNLTTLNLNAIPVYKAPNQDSKDNVEPQASALGSTSPRFDNSSLRYLVTKYNNCWIDNKSYKQIEVDLENLKNLLAGCIAGFPLPYDPKIHHGYVVKKVVSPGTKIFVQGDIHGNPRSLIHYLGALEKEGLLKDYKCLPDVHLIFLGDYVDRGEYNLQVLELLITLKAENPAQVTLLRGNHEDVEINKLFSKNDTRFQSFMAGNTSLLTEFYQTMPLSAYVGQETHEGGIQYVQFTHGLFELYADVFPLLTSPVKEAVMAISKKGELSTRIKELECDPNKDYAALLEKTSKSNKEERRSLKQFLALSKAKALAEKELKFRMASGSQYSAFNWGDLEDYTSFGILEGRHWKLCLADIKTIKQAFFPMIKYIVKAHQHFWKEHLLGKKVLATTLPVEADSCPAYKEDFGGLVVSYLLETATKVKDWKKKCLFRRAGESLVTISASFALHAEAGDLKKKAQRLSLEMLKKEEEKQASEKPKKEGGFNWNFFAPSKQTNSRISEWQATARKIAPPARQSKINNCQPKEYKEFYYYNDGPYTYF